MAVEPLFKKLCVEMNIKKVLLWNNEYVNEDRNKKQAIKYYLK